MKFEFDEFYRNREAKINDALKSLTGMKFGSGVPSFCKEYEEYNEFRETIKLATQKHANEDFLRPTN